MENVTDFNYFHFIQPSQEPQGSIEGLTDDALLHIVQYCDIPGVDALTNTSKDNYAIASDDSVWRAFARQIGLNTQEKNIRNQVKLFIADLRKKVHLISNSLEHTRLVKGYVPEIADNSLKFLSQVSTIDQINHLQCYLKARDTLIVWKTLANQIRQQVPELDNLSTSQDIIAQASKFSAWFAQHQTTLSQVQTLHLEDNQLTELPPEIGNLTQLLGLFLSNNQLTELPPEIGLLTQLKWLPLKNNKFTEFPPEIGQLTQLTKLDLKHNQLTSLPPEIGKLSQLAFLDLQNNQLTSLPPEIGQLTNLKGLDLYNNQVTSLPPEIGQLARLLKLNLENNQFTFRPPEIGQLTHCEIGLQGNPIPSEHQS
ncbi:MAG: Internalin-A [Chlamydiae bacterium]|nr:Internalin-A [Chlamydiota bacterium]